MTITTSTKRPPPRRTTDLDNWIAALKADTYNEALHYEFAAWADANLPATQVDLHMLPNWLRLAWCRKRPDWFKARQGAPAAWAIADEIRAYMEIDGGISLDHWGSTTIEGIPCFVTENYIEAASGAAVFADLADELHLAHGHTQNSAWGHGTIRAILFSAPELLPTPPKRLDCPHFATRQCAVCGRTVPEGKGVFWSCFGWIACKAFCDKLLQEHLKDYSKSKRGRHRTRAEVWQSLHRGTLDIPPTPATTTGG